MRISDALRSLSFSAFDFTQCNVYLIYVYPNDGYFQPPKTPAGLGSHSRSISLSDTVSAMLAVPRLEDFEFSRRSSFKGDRASIGES